MVWECTELPYTAVAEWLCDLATYHCRAEGHIFFVRESDLDKPETRQSEKLIA